MIGREDLKGGVTYGWLSRLAHQVDSPFRLEMGPSPDGADNATVVATISGGPPQVSMYLTSLYFCMTCMTTIGFGNVAAETDGEKVGSCIVPTCALFPKIS